MPNTDPNITAQIETFTQQLVATVEAAVAQRIQAGPCWCLWRSAEARAWPATKAGCGACGTCGGGEIGGKGRSHRSSFVPVPGCKNVAAPIFGMVCKDHKKVAKSKIKKYREERREGKVTRRQGPNR